VEPIQDAIQWSPTSRRGGTVVAKGVQLLRLLWQRMVMTAHKAQADVLLHRLHYALPGLDAAEGERGAMRKASSTAQPTHTPLVPQGSFLSRRPVEGQAGKQGYLVKSSLRSPQSVVRSRSRRRRKQEEEGSKKQEARSK
jgi:hypothetical protein